MFRILIFSIIVMMLLTCNIQAADAVGAIGLSFNQYAEDPGFGVLIGTEFDIDTTLNLKGRFLYVKTNWGFALDKMTLDGINYYDLPIWDLRLGLHTGGTYETQTGNVGFVGGLELRKHIGLNLGMVKLNEMFASGDVLFRDGNPYSYFVITIGAVLRL